ncbi:Putative nuclease [Frankliniella fusca]|uniref:Nuclease n=1 Tax=Frankliniella fusca TaxID=407009 RepID=A0AAE1GVG5_9NEOP|nr:Putative nuclease [Frankliniella fusca]
MDFNYFEERDINVVEEHRRRVNHQIHERFRIRDGNDPLNMSIPMFEQLYRMPQHAVAELCDILRPFLPQHTSPQQLPLMRKVLITLGFYASGSYQRMLGRCIDCAVSQTTVSRCLREITTALNHEQILNRFIRFPSTREERAPIIQRNEQLGLPRVLGLMDGFLLKLSNLPHDRERQAFFCRKGYLALNNQIICDADLRILNVDARWPGSLTDNQIWQASTARRVVEQAYYEDRCWLLGDSCYFTAPWLHIPIIHAQPGTPEFEYTRLHCRCRNAVERCIGVLKARWRVLGIDRCINYRDPAYAGMIVNACCVLHNYCIGRRIPNPPPLLENEDNDFYPEVNDLPINVQERGLEEMQFLINFANDRRLNRHNIVNVL